MIWRNILEKKVKRCHNLDCLSFATFGGRGGILERRKEITAGPIAERFYDNTFWEKLQRKDCREYGRRRGKKDARTYHSARISYDDGDAEETAQRRDTVYSVVLVCTLCFSFSLVIVFK